MTQRVVRHLTTGCGELNLTPGPGVTIKLFTSYTVMQSDGNSLKIDTFQEAVTSEAMN